MAVVEYIEGQNGFAVCNPITEEFYGYAVPEDADIDRHIEVYCPLTFLDDDAAERGFPELSELLGKKIIEAGLIADYDPQEILKFLEEEFSTDKSVMFDVQPEGIEIDLDDLAIVEFDVPNGVPNMNYVYWDGSKGFPDNDDGAKE